MKEFKFDIVTIPYPTQESSCCPEGFLSLEPLSASSEDLEVQDDISVIEEETNDETAEVKIEEAGQFVQTESKKRIVPRRFVSFLGFPCRIPSAGVYFAVLCDL